MIKIDKDNKANLYMQVYRQLKKEIMNEELKANTKLKPIRQMADDLGINPATVVKSYDLLEKEGLIYKKVGSGSFVSPVLEGISVRGEGTENNNELDMMQYGQVVMGSDINFASATPSPELFPINEYKEVINEVIERDGGAVFTYQKSQGYPPLREYIHSFLNSDGISADINNIMVVSGAQQGIDLVSKALINITDIVVVEEATYTAALSSFRAQGARIRTIPLTGTGMDLNELEDFLQKNDISCLYMMSNFHNPTGICWSEEKKEKLVELAEKYDFYIIEDDCLSELYYTGDKPVPTKSFDYNERVIYIKSYSKMFMPGLRLGFMVIPGKLLTSILSAKYSTDISGAGLTQRSFDLFMRKGLWDRHLQKMRIILNRRFHLMKEKMRYFHPDVSLVYGPRGGLYFWMSLPPGKSSEDFYLTALKNGVAFLPGGTFMAAGRSTAFFRLSFADANEKDIKQGMDIMIKIIRKFIEEGDKMDYMPLL
ncbi:MAG: PLP-dependent aminotransferase family protein [Halanaerobiales bacterium]